MRLFLDHFGKLFFVMGMTLNLTAFAGAPRCFLHGIMVPAYENKKKVSVSDMIRLRFDVNGAEEKDKCERMMQSYCNYNVTGKNYSPLRLKGSFKPDVEKTEEYTYKFSSSCKLITD